MDAGNCLSGVSDSVYCNLEPWLVHVRRQVTENDEKYNQDTTSDDVRKGVYNHLIARFRMDLAPPGTLNLFLGQMAEAVGAIRWRWGRSSG